MDDDSKTTSPWSRAPFIFAAVIVGLILAAGIYLVAVPLFSPPMPSVLPEPTAVAPSGTGPCPQLASETFSAGAALSQAPQGTNWVPTVYGAMPTIQDAGPAVVEPNGFRHCFGHSLNGAALAGATYIGQMADPDLWEQTLRQSAVQEPDMEAQIAQMRAAGVNKSREKVQVVGLTQVSATSDRSVTVGLVVVIGDTTAASNLAMVWDGTDWRVNPRTESTRLIDDYMVWGR